MAAVAGPMAHGLLWARAFGFPSAPPNPESNHRHHDRHPGDEDPPCLLAEAAFQELPRLHGDSIDLGVEFGKSPLKEAEIALAGASQCIRASAQSPEANGVLLRMPKQMRPIEPMTRIDLNWLGFRTSPSTHLGWCFTPYRCRVRTHGAIRLICPISLIRLGSLSKTPLSFGLPLLNPAAARIQSRPP